VSAEDLQPFLVYDGVLAALMVKDGSVLEVSGSPGTDTGGLAASLTLLMKESGMIADRLRKESLLMLLLEFEKRLLLIHALDDGRFIAIITRTDTNIGQISYQLKKLKAGSGA
jgi:predicted regulator of Ras-like GTPase activity (Roadblock/LC7/MglB family)